jgi:hypothetical protein
LLLNRLGERRRVVAFDGAIVAYLANELKLLFSFNALQ